MKRSRFVGIVAALIGVVGCDKPQAEQAASAAATETTPAPPPARVAQVDLCSLVTEAEAESILGKSLAAPQKQTTSGDCWYMREGGSDFGDVEFILSFIAAYPRSEAEFHSFVADQVKNLNESMKKSGVGAVQFTAEPARDVGAPAYFIDPGLYVLTGNRILAVGLGGSKGVAIAKTALSRLQ